MSSSTNKKLTTMRLPADVIEKLDAEAKGRGWTRSALVVQVLAKFLQDKGRRTSVEVIVE
jgi:uncharacterized protein (DUF4415 family)